MFLPVTPNECRRKGWRRLDIILVTGDAYIDSPHMGIALIGNVLAAAGYRVGVIAQPDLHTDDIKRLGEPLLFWGVSGGSVDSMVANYTPLKKRRKTDDFTPGGKNDRRPDRAVIAYANLIRRHFKNTRPIVLGGIEASLRRIVHYDYWSDKLRRSILFDAKADYLVYGMGEKTVVALADCLKTGVPPTELTGLCYIANTPRDGYLRLPDFELLQADSDAFIEMFNTFYDNNDPLTANGLSQKQDTRYLIQNPPAPYHTQSELDAIYDLPYENAVHPLALRHGLVKAIETIRFSISAHRGCYGECNFCAIAVHQGRTVRWRSRNSILREVRRMTARPDFKGVITDIGGPTANMYGFECRKKQTQGVCADRRCLHPRICPKLKIDHARQILLLKQLKELAGIRHVFIASGVRHDLILADEKNGERYLKTLVRHHVSGQLKIAPEHSEPHVLELMGKPDIDTTLQFKKKFDQLTAEAGKKQFLTYYLIAAYPGCRESDMLKLKRFTARHLGVPPEQTQIFTPAPSTYAALMYYTRQNPFSGNGLFVEKTLPGKQRQKSIITSRKPQSFSRKKR